MQGITVYCSSSDAIAPIYFDAARRLGAEIARRGLPAITGAGKMGLMAAVTDGALEAGGKAIGVIPQFMVDAGRNHPRLTETIVTDTMQARKSALSNLAIGVIALPGGVGTLDEVAEMITRRKLGLYQGAVVLLNINGYYDTLISWLNQSVAEGFTDADGEPWLIASTPEEAVELVLARTLTKQ